MAGPRCPPSPQSLRDRILMQILRVAVPSAEDSPRVVELTAAPHGPDDEHREERREGCAAHSCGGPGGRGSAEGAVRPLQTGCVVPGAPLRGNLRTICAQFVLHILCAGGGHAGDRDGDVDAAGEKLCPENLGEGLRRGLLGDPLHDLIHIIGAVCIDDEVHLLVGLPGPEAGGCDGHGPHFHLARLHPRQDRDAADYGSLRVRLELDDVHVAHRVLEGAQNDSLAVGQVHLWDERLLGLGRNLWLHGFAFGPPPSVRDRVGVLHCGSRHVDIVRQISEGLLEGRRHGCHWRGGNVLGDGGHLPLGIKVDTVARRHLRMGGVCVGKETGRAQATLCRASSQLDLACLYTANVGQCLDDHRCRAFVMHEGAAARVHGEGQSSGNLRPLRRLLWGHHLLWLPRRRGGCRHVRRCLERHHLVRGQPRVHA
mmetsp:Transcript_2668/g.8131  ORF Transcript_2668/g.8131 Transcript_2668/m.8131 type:complete len:427 (+) Transcript_2668:96-1376(+)